jgi:hypothetical protein
MLKHVDGVSFAFSPRFYQVLASLLLVCVMPITQAQTKSTVPAEHGNIQVSRQFDDLRKELLALRQEIQTLKTNLSLDEFLLKNKQDRSDAITLDLTQKAYQRLDTDNGFFLVSVEEAAPYLNGYKIRISIGNPSYATYTNYKLKVRYSKPFDWGKYTEDSYKEWDKAIQEKEISYPESLQPGAWNGIDVILAPVTADQLGYLTLSMTTSLVSLHAH